MLSGFFIIIPLSEYYSRFAAGTIGREGDETKKRPVRL
jgi:hypothetical protein